MLDQHLWNVAPTYLGMALVENPQLLVRGPVVDRRRTWRERLLSWPWRPWVAIVPEQTYEPDRQVYVLQGRTIVGHPVVIAELRKALAECEGPRR